MGRRQVTIMMAAVSTTLAAINVASAGKIYLAKQRVRTECGIPQNRTHYGHDTPRISGRAFAVANAPAEQGNLLLRTFHFRATSLLVDHIQLDRVGLALYVEQDNGKNKSAKFIATGRILHDGGDGGQTGNNVFIRIRAYAAPPFTALVTEDPVRIPPDARVLWTSEIAYWVSRDRPKHISLVPTTGGWSSEPTLPAHFDEITHLEVELEYQRDR